jgi:hypothetical protein
MADYRAQRLARIRADYERFTAHSNPMTEDNFTPPPELVQQWYHEANLSGAPYEDTAENWAYERHIATRAAQWGANQELEACCLWLNGGSKIDYDTAALLRAARRPKPPSLKEQALKRLAEAELTLIVDPDGTIRRALEQLDD